MTSDQYQEEALGEYSNIPKYMFAGNRVDASDSIGVTDPVQQYNTVSELSPLPPMLQKALCHNTTHFAANHAAKEKPKTTVTSSSKRYKKDKNHKCALCIKNKAFTSRIDLDRHLKSRHGIYKKGDKLWYCPVEGCATAGKKWPRLDNFRHHLSTQHGIKGTHDDSFETVKEDQYRSENYSARIGTKSPLPAIDPQLVNNGSQVPSDVDITFTPSQNSDVLFQSAITHTNYFQASDNPERVPMPPFVVDTEIVMHILNILQLIPGAVRLVVQRGHQIHPASRDVLTQVIARYSELHPQVWLGFPPTQQPLPMTTAMAPDQPPGTSMSLPWSSMNGNHPTQQFFPNRFPPYSQPHFNSGEDSVAHNGCPQMNTPNPTFNTNNQLQRPRDVHREQLHQAQDHFPMSIFERSQQNARHWEALLANIGDWAQDLQ